MYLGASDTSRVERLRPVRAEKRGKMDRHEAEDTESSLATGWKRHALFGLGIFSMVMAVAGLILPVLQAAPFLILAAYCFSRSSPRCHRWMTTHPYIGPLVREWEQHRAIRPHVKWGMLVGIGFMVVSALLVGFYTSWYAGGGVLLLAVVFAVVVYRLPEVPEIDERVVKAVRSKRAQRPSS